MRNPHGYGIAVSPDGPTAEFDYAQCAHCNAVFRVPTGAKPADLGGWCFMCNQCTCSKCAAIGTCFPFEKKLDMYEKGKLAVLD